MILVFNHDRSRIMTISKSGRKSTQKWDWGTGYPVEEVTEYVYLEVLMTNMGNFNRHIEMTTTKAIGRMNEAWTIGDRRFEDTF